MKTVITIDPHTTTMLRSVYPRILDGYDIEVRSYLEVLAEKGLTPSTMLSGDVAIHDSCVFARYESVIDEPRELLTAAGVTIRDPENSGRQTWCCGGPAESLYPAKAAVPNQQGWVALMRAEALVRLGQRDQARVLIRDARQEPGFKGQRDALARSLGAY